MPDKKTVSLIIIITILRVSTKAWAGEATEVRAGEAAEQVQALTTISLQLVDEAIAVLALGWPIMSQEQRNTFLLSYDPANKGDVDTEFVSGVLGNYQQIHAILTADLQVAYAPQNDKCEGKRLYFTDLAKLYVCPFFLRRRMTYDKHVP